MPAPIGGMAAALREDFDAVFRNGIQVLESTGALAVPDLDPQIWTLKSISRTLVNYTGEARGDTSGLYPERAQGSLQASLTGDGLQWQWQAPNLAFDWMENSRSVSEDWDFVAREEYLVTLENGLTGEVRSETVSIAITGNSDEVFDVLVLAADTASVNGKTGVQRAADNLVAAGFAGNVTAAAFEDIWNIDTRFVDSILVYTNDPRGDWAPMVGDFLKTYVDTTNGGVVIGNFAFTSDYSLAGGIMEDGYAAFSVGSGTGAGPFGGQIVASAGAESDAIFAGVDLQLASGGFFLNSNFPTPTVDPGATLLAADELGTPLLARSESGRVISANFWPRDLGESNLGPNGESLLTTQEQEFYELFVNALYDASDNPLFAAPSAEDLTERARTEVIGEQSFGVFEAESASFSANMDVFDGRGASGGQYIDFPETDASLEVAWTVDIDEAGYYAVDFVYALSGERTSRPLTVLVDGVVAEILPFVPQNEADWTSWTPQSTLLELGEGRHTITLVGREGQGINSGANIDFMRISDDPVSAAFLTTPSSGTETVNGMSYVKYEAEAAVLSDEFLFAEGHGASGNTFVDFPETDKPLTIAWTVDIAGDGVYGLEFLYALAEGKLDRPLLLTIDGDFVDTLDFGALSNAQETLWSPERIELSLEAGTHVIELTSAADAGMNNGANLDYLRITQEALTELFTPVIDQADTALL